MDSKSRRKGAGSLQIIQTEGAPAAVGPYVQALTDGRLTFLSGQLGLNPATGDLAESTADQARQALLNLEAVLLAGGMNKQDIVKTTLFLTNMDDFATVNEVYAEFFADHRPARSCVAVSALPKSAKFEVECVAIRNNETAE